MRIGFWWQGFGSGTVGGCRSGLWPPAQAEPVPASSRMDPALAHDEPVSDASGASVMACLRKGKNHCAAAVGGRSKEEHARETTLQALRSAKKEALELRLPCSPWRRPWGNRLSCCSPQRTVVGRIPTLQPTEDPTPWRVDMPCRKLQPMERSPGRSRFAVRELWGTPAGAVLEGLYPTEEPHWGAGVECEEGASETNRTPSSTSPLHCLAGRR